MNKPDLMVDIETLGTGRNALIVQIGACFFDRHTGEIGDTIRVNLSIEDSMRHGCEVDSGALKFWFEQGTEKMTWLKDPLPMTKGLQNFRNFCYQNKNASAWAHATFDFPILANSYRKLNQGCPISYRNMRDIRTLVDLSGLAYAKPEKKKTHDGLDDCLYQVEYCVQCFSAIRRDK